MSEDYWEGVRDTIQYFHDELGYEDAYETSIAAEVMFELGDDIFDK
jgi:hypothetical protein